jgi:hypothetical protein
MIRPLIKCMSMLLCSKSRVNFVLFVFHQHVCLFECIIYKMEAHSNKVNMTSR